MKLASLRNATASVTAMSANGSAARRQILSDAVFNEPVFNEPKTSNATTAALPIKARAGSTS